MVFGTSDVGHGESTPFEIALSHKMQDLWLAFMADSANGLWTRGWLPYRPNGTAIEFGKGDKLVGSIAFGELGSACNGSSALPGGVRPH